MLGPGGASCRPGERPIVGHGVSTDGYGDMQVRPYDDTSEPKSEFRGRRPRERFSDAAMHGARKRVDSRDVGH